MIQPCAIEKVPIIEIQSQIFCDKYNNQHVTILLFFGHFVFVCVCDCDFFSPGIIQINCQHEKLSEFFCKRMPMFDNWALNLDMYSFTTLI